MTECPYCSLKFSRRDGMLRHCRTKHKETIKSFMPPPPQGTPQGTPPPPHETPQGAPPPPPTPPPPPPQGTPQGTPPPPHETPQGAPSPQYELSPTQLVKERKCDLVLYHPFTMMVSGPTACGKTTFVKKLLQQNDERIQPTIQRIVWLYRRWQPMYDVIRTTVIPKVEFIQGIPSDLDDDDFFDPRFNNLLVLDDMFSESGKDKRITDLFTEGSHHRSLSVISINQNLFGNKDPTQRKNCHYIVLFNNPVDRQSLMTLARQMYPGDTDKFQKAFAKSTKKPYGYLLVDLKPFTSENDRLKYALDRPETNQDTNKSVLTNQMQDLTEYSIKDQDTGGTGHISVGVQTVHIDKNSEEENMADKAQACNDCGLLFDNPHDVQRHVKRGWCPETNEPPAKRAKTEDSSNVIDEDVEDNEGYKHLWHFAHSCSKDRFNKLFDQYVDNGENEDEAAQMAEERVKPYKEKNFFERYQTLLEIYWLPLMTNAIHRDIVGQINDIRSKGASLTSAVKRVLKKNKSAFEELFEVDESDDDSEDDTDSEDSE